MADTLRLIVLALVILVGPIGFGWMMRQAALRRGEARAAYFDSVRTLFDGGVESISPHGFARLSASYRGHDFNLQAVPDTLTFRKLPALWLMVTLPKPLPLRATFDLMMRPSGGETFSNFAKLPVQVTAPVFCPDHAQLRTDDAAGLPPEGVLRGHLSIFSQDRAKELVISPKGLRIVWLAEEADRNRYLLFRDAEMGTEPLAPEILRPLLDHLIRLSDDLIDLTRQPEAEVA